MTARIKNGVKPGISQRQNCKVCGYADKFDYHVPDAVWKEIVPEAFHNKVVCLGCFDKFAFEKDVDYAEALDVLYFAGDRAVFKFEAVLAERV
jgi:hypothetical protein